MMQGGVDLLKSERGVFCIVLVIACTVLVALGKLTAENWIDFVKWIAITLVTSKTLTGAVETWTGKSAAIAPGQPVA